MKTSPLTLCLITDFKRIPYSRYHAFLMQAIAGGITALQLRDKTLSPSTLLNIAHTLKEWLSPFSIPLIINDHVDIAKSVNADGIHGGHTDFSPEAARHLLGPDKIIGVSVDSIDALNDANKLSCIDYIAASAVFPSTSKHDCKTIWGLAGLKKLVDSSAHPVVAIGGIQLTNISSIIQQGAEGVAIISAIHLANNPEQMIRQMITAIHQTQEDKK